MAYKHFLVFKDYTRSGKMSKEETNQNDSSKVSKVKRLEIL